MEFYLVHSRDDIGVLNQKSQMLFRKVGYADRPRPSRTVYFFHKMPCIQRTARNRPLNQIQIHVVETQTLQTSVKGFFNITDSLRCIPDFCGNEQFFPRNTAISDTLAYIHFVFKGGSGIEKPVAYRCGVCDHALRFARTGHFIQTESEARHPMSGVQIKVVFHI